MIILGWIAIILEIMLLLIWIYSIFFQKNGTDPAGKGLAIVFVLGLGIYIAAGIMFILIQQTWSIILTLLMATVPLAIVIIGLLKHYGSRQKI